MESKGTWVLCNWSTQDFILLKRTFYSILQVEKPRTKALIKLPGIPRPSQEEGLGSCGPSLTSCGLRGEVACRLPRELWLGCKNSHGQGTTHPNLMAVLSSPHLTNFAIVLINKCNCSGFKDEKTGSRKLS